MHKSYKTHKNLRNVLDMSKTCSYLIAIYIYIYIYSFVGRAGGQGTSPPLPPGDGHGGSCTFLTLF